MCTGIRLRAKTGGIAYGRTLEFGQEMDSQIIMIPRNFACAGTSKEGAAKGLLWKSKYAVVGANALSEVGVIDGVNEKGLAGGLFYFSNYADFQRATAQESAISIAPWELLTWILTNFSSVEQVRDELPSIKVVNALFGPWGIIPPVHAVLHDVTGKSLVIEYVDGVLHMYDNVLGVITNAPTFDWHLTNLQNYITLSNQNVEEKMLHEFKLVPLGQGSGMIGLPGDFTSPSRFMRAVAFSQSVVHLETEDDARDAVFHILDLFNIPLGVIQEVEPSEVHYDYTQWTSVCDLSNKRYYFHTYKNRQIHQVDLMAMDLDAKEPVIIPMEYMPTIVDCTPVR